jgi:hypothetical protein
MSQLDKSAFSASEFKLDLKVGGQSYADWGFQTATIPGMSEATTEEFKLNNETRKVITAPGTDNNFVFTTSFTKEFFIFRQAAKDLQDYEAIFTGKEGSAFAGDTIVISGKIASPGDLSIGVDGVPTYDFNGTTNYIKFTEA